VLFDAKVTFPQDMVMEPRGTFHVANGARVTIRLHDADLTQVPAESVTFNIDQDQTIMQDQHSVRDDTWGRKIDMSKDPKMYGFHSENYYLVFEFDPRATSPFIQDRLGWLGEGMTDKKYLWKVDDTPPVTILRKVFKLNKQHISGAKPVTEADVVPSDVYDKAMKEAAAKALAKQKPKE
jgi:hypothetical protein